MRVLFCSIFLSSFRSTVLGTLLCTMNKPQIKTTFSTYIMSSYWMEKLYPSELTWTALTQNKRSASFRKNRTPIRFEVDDKSSKESIDSVMLDSWKFLGLFNSGLELGVRGPNRLLGSICFDSAVCALCCFLGSYKICLSRRAKDRTWLNTFCAGSRGACTPAGR